MDFHGGEGESPTGSVPPGHLSRSGSSSEAGSSAPAPQAGPSPGSAAGSSGCSQAGPAAFDQSEAGPSRPGAVGRVRRRQGGGGRR